MIRNNRESARQNGMGRLLRSGASVLALGVMAVAAPAFAQDTDEKQDEPTITVTGIRASLASSQNIKRNSDTVVDAITASDIGALPDRSVTEALQRVPGVAMNRFAGSNDPDHFSVEGSGVVVRGLSFVRSEFNGRDTFSTGVYGQSINFSDVPSELLGSVEVYKNSTAEMIEGGLSGTVNLNTRLPFQNKGFHLGIDAEANYGDMAKQWSPTGSLLISNTWETGIGTIGILGDVSYSQIKSRADAVHVTNYQTRDNQLAIDVNAGTSNLATRCRNPLPADTNTQILPPNGSPCGTASTAGSDGLADWAPLRYAPLGGQYRTQDYNRERFGIAAGAQWESLDRRAILTAQFLRSESKSQWGEHSFESAPDLSEYNTYPAGCRQNDHGPVLVGTTNATVRAECPIGFENYTYDDQGVFQKGYITMPGTGWRTASSGSNTTTVPTGGIQQSLSTRNVDDRNIVADYGLNFKFTPDDHWQMNLDAQYVRAQHDNLDVSVFGSTFADNELDLTGDFPMITAHKPLTLSATWAAPNPAMAAETDAQYFADPRWSFWRAAMDHTEHSIGEEMAFKADFAYNFGDDHFLKRIKFGARYADRDQNIRATTYNWGAISETWGNSGRVPVTFAQAGTDHLSFFDYPDFFRGQANGPPGGYYYNQDLIASYNSASTFFKGLNQIWSANAPPGPTALSGNNCWLPVAERRTDNCQPVGTVLTNGTVNQLLVVPGTPFLPSEIQNVSERNYQGYIMASFGGDMGGITIDGNIGVRYANTQVVSEGSFTIPTQGTLGISSPFATRCAPSPPPANAPAGTPPTTPTGICLVGAAAYAQLQQFANGANTPNTAVNNYDYWLPSLNLKFGLTDKLIARFAASRALARPGMSDVRNFISIGTNPQDASRLYATAGNPFLKPALSDQFDVTLEWYFARVGSLTFDAFYKNIHNFFYQAITPRDITNNGVTYGIDIRGQANYNGTGKVKGFEVAYQQTYDFLPGIFSGLGMSANYTYIESQGLPVNRPANGPGANQGGAAFLPLEQLSKHNVNVAVFYEKGPISLRVAYNWRSKFLLTSADVIYPYYPIYNDAGGQVDASAFINLTDNIKIGVQGVNLTNDVTVTLQQFTVDGKLGPRSYFMNDRRFSFILRGNF